MQKILDCPTSCTFLKMVIEFQFAIRKQPNLKLKQAHTLQCKGVLDFSGLYMLLELYCGLPWAIVGLRVSSACSGADYQLCKSKLGKSSNPQATTTRTSLLCTVSISYLSESQSLSLRVS